jgi:hypothetical protein
VQVSRSLSRGLGLAQLLLWALAVSACGLSRGCGKGDKAVLETPPERTRCATVAMRSYRGSREALMNAAIWLIGDNAHLGEVSDASDPAFLRPEGAEPAFAARARTYCNQLSIAELLRRLRAVEERLRPSPDPDPAHPTLKFELWWVEGVHGTFEGLELPSPLILDETWANHLFAVGAETAAIQAMEEGRESKLWAKRVALKFESTMEAHAQRVLFNLAYQDMDEGTAAEDGGALRYEAWGWDEADLLADAARLAFVMDVHRDQYARDAKLREELIGMQGVLAETLLDKRAVSWVQAFSVDLPKGSSLSERCRRWIDSARSAARAARVAVSRVVVFDMTPTHVSGALLGERKPEDQLIAYAPLEPELSTRPLELEPRVWREGDPPSRGFGATLRTRLPILPSQTAGPSLGEAEHADP